MAARLLAAAGAGAGAVRGGAEAGGRNRPLGSSGRRALGHSDGAAGGGAADQRERQRQGGRLAGAAVLRRDPRPRRFNPGARHRHRHRCRHEHDHRRGAGGGIRRRRARRTGAEDEDDEDEEDDELGPVQRAAPDEDEDDEDEDEDEDDEEILADDDEEEAQELEAEGDAEEEEPRDWVDDTEDAEESLAEQPEDPNAAKRFWFEHATGAGKTVAALGFVEASRTGGILILTHRRNLVDQFHGELRERGYSTRISRPLLLGEDSVKGPVTVETYQWFVRNAGKISSAYTIVICDEAHTALGEKTSAAIREWTGPIFIGMTATGALIARHVTDLFPTQTSRFDLAQAARRGVIAPLRCVRISPGVGVRTIAKVPLRRGEVDTEFDQEELAALLDQQPFNMAAANLYKTRFNGVPGVVYAAGVQHAYNLAEAFRAEGIKAQGVSAKRPSASSRRFSLATSAGTSTC